MSDTENQITALELELKQLKRRIAALPLPSTEEIVESLIRSSCQAFKPTDEELNMTASNKTA